MTKQLIVFIIIPIVLLSTSLFANLGDTLPEAKARQGKYAKLYGAINPLYETDKNGIVIFECWAAPPEMWSRSKALEFGKMLVPEELKDENPKMGKLDGTLLPFIYSDGTQIFLSMAGNLCMGVEVRLSSYDGPNC